MNPVDNPLTQMMQIYGAAPSDSSVVPAGIQVGIQSETDADYLTQFTGYIEGADAAEGAIPSAAFAELAKNRTQLIHAVQAGAAFAVDPSTSVTQSGIAVQTLSSNSTTLQPLLAAGQVASLTDGDGITPELAEAFSLAVNYRTATPAALSSGDLEALQSAAPAAFASLSAAQVTSGEANPSDAASSGPTVLPQHGAEQNTATPGQFLPASELKFLFSETPTLPLSSANGGPVLLTGPLFGANIPENAVVQAAAAGTPQLAGRPLADIITPASGAQVPVMAAVESTATVPVAAPAATLAELPASTTLGAAPTSGEHLVNPDGKSVAHEGGNEASRANAVAAKIPAHVSQQNGNPEIDADGQILAVNQKVQPSTNSPGTATTLTPARASQIAQTHAQAHAAAQAPALATPTPPVSENATKRVSSSPAAKLPDDLALTKAPTMQPALAAATATRGSTDWTSPWITPERAAGWPDGFATSLVSTGLGGLMGTSNGVSTMGLMGGQPDAKLGGHVTKQLNLNLTRAVKAGEQEFSMRMDPPELGRVSVKLRFDQNGLVRSQIMAERPETLELLQREVRGLERAIEAGGHKSEQGGISFSLDSGGKESAGKAFAEAMQQDRLKDEIEGRSGEQNDGAFTEGDMEEVEIDLDEILAHVTPETGLDVRV